MDRPIVLNNINFESNCGRIAAALEKSYIEGDYPCKAYVSRGLIDDFNKGRGAYTNGIRKYLKGYEITFKGVEFNGTFRLCFIMHMTDKGRAKELENLKSMLDTMRKTNNPYYEQLKKDVEDYESKMKDSLFQEGE